MNDNPKETEAHEAARPMKVVTARDGSRWLCDVDVSEDGDLAAQGCWRCSEIAFTRDD
jgi:hypothetical protein